MSDREYSEKVYHTCGCGRRLTEEELFEKVNSRTNKVELFCEDCLAEDEQLQKELGWG